MSGGSMDYTCYKIEEYADHLKDKELVELAKDFAKVFHDAEWWHSGDISGGGYNKTVHEFKEKWLAGPENRLKNLNIIVEKEIDELKNDLLKMISLPRRCGNCKSFIPLEDKESDYGSCPKYKTCLTHGWEDACEDYKPIPNGDSDEQQ